MSEEAWFFELNGERKGPVSHLEILALLQDQKITKNTLVWTTKFGDQWKTLRECPELASARPKGPLALPTEYINDVFVWLIAGIPLIGILIELSIVQQIPGLDIEGSFYRLAVAVTYAVSYAGLCLLDAQQIRKSGSKSIVSPGWFILIPVYLYIRSSKLKNWLFLWLWLASFSIATTLDLIIFK